MAIKILLSDNYTTTIRNSVGSKLFKNLWAEVDGEKKDILVDGDLSCAQFVSGILYLFKLITDRHATVDGTVKDLEQSNWTKITSPKKGCILVWENILYPDGQEHKHIGFYIGDGLAISNSPADKSPQTHHWTYGEKTEKSYRKITAMYWNNLIN